VAAPSLGHAIAPLRAGHTSLRGYPEDAPSAWLTINKIEDRKKKS
jgi:hypothetical protein